MVKSMMVLNADGTVGEDHEPVDGCFAAPLPETPAAARLLGWTEEQIKEVFEKGVDNG